MAYSVGNSEVANYANTSSGQVTNVAADDGLGGAGVATNVVDRVALSFVVATNIQFLTIDVTSLAGYVAGITDVTITVNPNVYVYGTPVNLFNFIQNLNALDASMQIIGGTAGDTIKLVNNGNIVGFGGDGAGVYQFVPECCGCGYNADSSSPGQGNVALSFITPGITLAIENNGYIAGGGGGGGGVGGIPVNNYTPGGGGGAGGGVSGIVGPVLGGDSAESTIRAVPPNAGNNGISPSAPNGLTTIQGGSGGFVLPGTGGASAGTAFQGVGGGGGAGGGGAASSSVLRTFDNIGGSANNAAPTYTTFGDAYQGGGGGGWGASGAGGYTFTSLAQVGAAGGNSIVTNGNAYTLTGSGTLYGSVNTALTSVVYTFPATVETGSSLTLNDIPGYTAGTNVVLIVPANVRLMSNDTATSALFISRLPATNPSTIRLIINGAILGAGGKGGSETSTPVAGGVALTLQTGLATTLIVENTVGYIAGGGGGGGRGINSGATVYPYGGGGAGLGGSSGGVGSAAYNAGVASGIASGTNGTVVGPVSGVTYASGGSGGTILPGVSTNNTGTFTAGTYAGLGGQAGGSGSFNMTGTASNPGNRGGGFGVNGGGTTGTTYNSGGGGGGWGSSGVPGRRGSLNIQNGSVAGITVKTTASSVFVTNTNNFAGIVSA